MADNVEEEIVEEVKPTFETVEAVEGEGKILDDAELEKIVSRVKKTTPIKKTKKPINIEKLEGEVGEEEGTQKDGEDNNAAVNSTDKKANKKKEDAKVINIDGSDPDDDDEDFSKLFPEYKADIIEEVKTDTTPAKVDVAPVAEVVVEDSPEIKEYKTKAQLYEELNNDPYVKALFAFKESGKDISELPEFLGLKALPKISSFKNPTEADLSVIEDLIGAEIAKLDLPKDDVKDAIEEQMEKFYEMDTLQRKAFFDAKIATMKAEQGDQLKNFKVEKKAAPIIVHKGNHIDTRTFSEPEKTVQIIEKAENDLKAILEKNIGKEIGGFVVLSQTVLDKIMPAFVTRINSEGAVKDKNNKIVSYNVTETMLRKTVIAEYDELHTQLVRKDAVKRAKKQWIKDNNYVDAGNTKGSIASHLHTKTVDEIIKTNGKLEYVNG